MTLTGRLDAAAVRVLRGAAVFAVAYALATHVFAAGAADSDLQPLPPLAARITDLTGTLSTQQKQTLENDLAALEQRKGAQVAVLMVPTTAPEDIAAYATRVFDAWKLGREGVDDGVLVIVAKNDRRVRIEVAYGLEGAIPDAAALRIAHDYMTPKFRSGDFDAGIAAGVAMISRLVDGEALPPPPQQPAARDMPWWSPVYLLIGFLFGGIAGVLLLLIFSRPSIHRALLGWLPEHGRLWALGLVNALPVWLLLRNPLSALGALFAGSGLAAIANLARTPQPFVHARGRGHARGNTTVGSDSGSWIGSASTSSSSDYSSSSSSGSDFSGGGGSSGGGGASDSW